MESANPRVKRLYQPTLDCYVNHSDPLTSHPPSQCSTSYQPGASLPPSVQSTLLNVGMRVRKAVPGGYQTAQKSLRPLSEASANVPTRVYGLAELMPVCGINNVGGHAYHPSAASGQENAHSLAINDNDKDIFPSTQETTISSVTMNDEPRPPMHTVSQRKRQRDEDDADDADCEDNSIFASSLPQTSRSVASRPKTRPFTRRRSLAGVARHADVSMTDASDFEDASFLLPPID